jgi:hypothetical protein
MHVWPCGLPGGGSPCLGAPVHEPCQMCFVRGLGRSPSGCQLAVCACPCEITSGHTLSSCRVRRGGGGHFMMLSVAGLNELFYSIRTEENHENP